MLFWLKKAVSYFLAPLPLCLLLLAVGWFLSRSARHARAGRRLIGAALLILLVLSNRTVSTWLVRPLETAYPAIPEFVDGTPLPPAFARCRFVAVLGSGHDLNPALSATNQISHAAEGRLIEAVRLLHALPEAKLITSGATKPGQPSHAAVMAQAAVSLGIDRARIVELDTPRDTEEEAREIKRIAGPAPVALVTSAWHMPRSMIAMRAAGVDALPCPAHFASRRPAPAEWRDALWDVESFVRSTYAVHEGLGLAWYRLKRKF